MRPGPAIFVSLAATPALAHPGHLADLAGHDHWIAGGVIGAAVLAGIWGALKGRKDRPAKPQEPEMQEEPA